MQHKRLQTGTATEKHDTILGLHRRLYHKEASELRKLLTNSGVPLSVVATVDDVLKSCEICNSWKQGHAKPVIKVRLAPRFNNAVYL
jgi:crotonobetainyl-CoA:carnitine CoA-transferase CaiB-like acyl-CoA transferase